FFLGLALVVMSLGAFVSELRTTTFWVGRCGLILFAIAVAFVVMAALVNAKSLFFELLGAGILIGELGAELASEDYQDQSSTNDRQRFLIGVAVAGVGAALLVAGGTDPTHVMFVVIAFVVIAAMASAAGDGLVVVVLLAIALV